MTEPTAIRHVTLTQAQLDQILYCMEQQASDYEPGTQDCADYDSALEALQSSS